MTDFINTAPEDMPGTEFLCECGLTHKVDLENILIGTDAIKDSIELIVPYSKTGKIFVVSDNNTYAIAGKMVCDLLRDNNIDHSSFIFETSDHQLNPDEKSLGRLIYEFWPDVSLIVAVGSGVINDLCRTISYKVKVPFIIIGTAPSMDGYASLSSPLVIDGFKLSQYHWYPITIVCDTKIMKDAPMIMLQAGFGDIIGKLTSLADWELSRLINKEHYCDVCAGLMQNAVSKCIENIDGILKREESSIGYMAQALVIAGISMGIYTSTRPASSTEHYFAHYWDMAAIEAGQAHPLHGNSVGVGTLLACDAYEYMKDLLPSGFEYPKTDHVLSLFNKLGSTTSPKALGISKDLFTRSVLHCMDDRPKYGILDFAKEKGILNELAEFLTNKYYDI